MKYLILILISSRLWAANNELALKLPFQNFIVSDPLSLDMEILVPSFVDKNVYMSAIQEDCKQFRSIIDKYRNSLRPEDFKELVKAPLPHTMSHSYEVKFRFKKINISQLQQQGALLYLEISPSTFSWEADLAALHQVAEEFGVKSDLSMGDAEPGYIRLNFLSRDLVCDYYSKNLKLSIIADTKVRLGDEEREKLQQLLGPLVKEVRDVISSDSNENIKASTIGYKFQRFLKDKKEAIPESFRSVAYLWDLFFVEKNSFNKSYLWRDDNKINEWHPQTKQKIYIQGAVK